MSGAKKQYFLARLSELKDDSKHVNLGTGDYETAKTIAREVVFSRLDQQALEQYKKQGRSKEFIETVMTAEVRMAMRTVYSNVTTDDMLAIGKVAIIEKTSSASS